MATDYEKRQAKWAEKEQAKEDKEREDEIEIGEITGKATENISNSDKLKVRIDHVDTMRLKLPVDIQKGDSVKVVVKADWSMRGKKEEQRWGREKEIQAGEALEKASGHIKKGDEVKIRIDNIETMKIMSSAELKKGDTVRVIITKL